MDISNENSVRGRIKKRMDELNLNQNAAAIKAGLQRTAVRDILEGRSKNPRADTLKKLANALECSLEWLSTGQGITNRTDQVGNKNFELEQLIRAVDFIIQACKDQEIEDIDIKECVRIAGQIVEQSQGNLDQLGPGIAHILVRESSHSK